MNIKNVLFSILMMTCVSSPIFAGGVPSYKDQEVEKAMAASAGAFLGLGAGAVKGASAGAAYCAAAGSVAGPLGAVAGGVVGAGVGAIGGAAAGYFGFVICSALHKELKKRN